MISFTVCIDCSPLLVRSAGVKTYLYHWLNSMRALRPEAIRTFLAPSRNGHLHHEHGHERHPLQIAALLSLNRLPGFVCGLATPRCEIFHCSNLLRKAPSGPRITATLHDLTAWILPDLHTAGNVAADAAFAEHVLKRAAGLIAVSEHTKNDAVRILRLDPARIRVIHPGVPESYFSVSAESITSAADKHNLRVPYFLFVGTIEPRKNVDNLLRAWNSLPRSFRMENELVIVGMQGWNAESTMRRLIQAGADSAGVKYLGYVPESSLPGIIAGAQALVYPSLYEGFGIPVAQAMAAGCPVITSNVSSLPEVTSGAALLIDPMSVSELSAAMRAMIDSPGVRARLRADGLRIAERYRWNVAAGKSLAWFGEIA